ncbi:MAG: ROK family protein, partial [Clostridia bacterium]
SVRMEQGLGAGVVQNGVIYSGAQGIAGNIGHMSIDYQGIPCECGNVGCLRNYCTAKALVRDVTEELQASDAPSTLRGAVLTSQSIISAAKAGDALALKHLKRIARYLGFGLVNTIYTYNPDLIILSEEFSQAGDLYLSEIREVFAARLRPAIAERVRLRFSCLEGDVVLIGAITLVIDRIMQSPSRYLDLA